MTIVGALSCDVPVEEPPYPNSDHTADFGDFVSNEDEELDLEEVVEPWAKYDINKTPHVFYPVRLGEVLNEILNRAQNRLWWLFHCLDGP